MQVPPFREGKHRTRLYAVHSFGALPGPPAPKGEKGTYMQRIKKSEIITLRVTPGIKRAIQERAKAADLTVTDYLCCNGLGKEIVRVEGLEQVLSELKAQGRNLNQLTTLANMGRVTMVKGAALAENYAKIYEQLRELLREVT